MEYPLNMHRTASNQTALVSEILYISDEENLRIVPAQRKKTFSIFSDKFCDEQAYSYLLPKGKCGYTTPRDILISHAR